MPVTRFQTRFLFWFVFLSGAVAIYFFGIRPDQREREAQRQSAAILEPAIKANPKFSKVEIHLVEKGPFFVLSGKVRSEADLQALKKLVADTALPRTPIIDVGIPENP